ncbi:MAG: hypothetical protein B7Z44_10685 [Caulobacter sp. 12-67-6]|nr:MAG: hypothetical protein B7Z44_10685 [Caulobacter sp. 12-67-6]OZA75397.1 MAG: hypothetical protein B7X77_07385 [Caulobacter sp. 39-67-4]
MLGVSLVALIASTPAFAQVQAPSSTVEEIIVTATKREQTLQDVPVSVSVTGAQADVTPISHPAITRVLG